MIIVDGVARQTHPRLCPISSEFDLIASSFDNSGNTVHAEAPFAFWDDGSGGVLDARQLRNRTNVGIDETVRFANVNATHYVLSAANFLLFENMTAQRRLAYKRLQQSLEALTIPLVVLGIGAQAPSRWNPTDHKLPSEAIEFMQFLGAKCEIISVRGEFTASVFRDYAGVTNTIVTGCPSFFMSPHIFTELRSFLSEKRSGNVAFTMTNYRKPAEQELMGRALESDAYWFGVKRDAVNNLSVEANRSPELALIPQEISFLVEGNAPRFTRDRVIRYFGQRYRKFDDAVSWETFNREYIRFAYGTRFHGNMSVLLAGKPALWVVHDARTREMVDALDLPGISLTEALNSDADELERSLRYDEMFDGLSEKFRIFNKFLNINRLPEVRLEF